MPMRGLIGYRGQLLTETRGTALLHQIGEGYGPWAGEVTHRTTGVLVSDRAGESNAYGLFNLQERAELFIGAGVEVYEGMIVGENSRPGDMDVNPTKEKKLTNIRTHAHDEALRLDAAAAAHPRVGDRVHRRRRAGRGDADVDPAAQAAAVEARTAARARPRVRARPANRSRRRRGGPEFLRAGSVGSAGTRPGEDRAATTPSEGMMRRSVLGAVMPAALLLLLLPGSVSAFPLTTCSLELLSRDAGGATIDTARSGAPDSTQADPFEVELEGSVVYDGTTMSSSRTYTYSISVFNARRRSRAVGPTTTRNRRRRTVSVAANSPFRAAGLYYVSGTYNGEGGTCTGSGWFRLLGDPVGTVPWIAGARARDPGAARALGGVRGGRG